MLTRREMLCRTGTGLGMLGLAGVLNDARMLGAEAAPGNPLAAKLPHFAARAKHIIHIYLNGGPSQVDTFDPKPMLTKYDGQPLPSGKLTTERHTGGALGSPFRFQKYGECGMEVSEIFAKTAAHVDDLCFIRSMHANTPNHEQSMRLMNCGDERLSRPSYGAWLTYGLGTENENLPGFVAMCPGLPVADVSNWRSAFLPGIYQGTHLDTRKTNVEELIENIVSHSVGRRDQRRQLDLLTQLNRRHQVPRADESELEARIQAFELAFRMQLEASEVFDTSREPQHILDAYGNSVHGRQLLIARRMVEHGVRVVQVYHGDVQPWDSHNDLAANHRKLGNECDGPIAALLTDLKQRGLWDKHAGNLRRRVRPHARRRIGERQIGRWSRPQPLGLHRLAGRRRRSRWYRLRRNR